jgi:hypothetical protein
VPKEREVRFEEIIFGAWRAEALRETPAIGCSAWTATALATIETGKR